MQAQWEALLLVARRKHHPRSRLCMDLTSVPSSGRELPFVRVQDEVYGIHLVVLYAVHGTLKFPLGYPVYQGKGTPSPVRPALDLLATEDRRTDKRSRRPPQANGHPARGLLPMLQAMAETFELRALAAHTSIKKLLDLLQSKGVITSGEAFSVLEEAADEAAENREEVLNESVD